MARWRGRVLTNVVIYDEKLYHGNGDVNVWMHKVKDRFVLEAKEAAPVRTGDLVAGINGDVHPSGRRKITAYINSTSDHTMYVLKGTSTPIMTNRAWRQGPESAWAKKFVGRYPNRTQRWYRRKGFWMPVGKSQGNITHYRVTVRGQRQNNFLLKAWTRTARRHRALSGRGTVPARIGRL